MPFGGSHKPPAKRNSIAAGKRGSKVEPEKTAVSKHEIIEEEENGGQLVRIFSESSF